MAAAFVQVTATQEDQDNAAAGWVFTVDTAPSAGNRLILIVNNEDATPPGPVTDTASNTWVKLADLNTTGGGHASSVWTAHLAGVPTSITITKSAAGDRPTVAGCIELSGVDSANDTTCLATAVVQSSTTGTSVSTGTTGTPSQDDCIAVGVWDNNDGKTLSGYTNSFTEAVDIGSTAGGAGTPHIGIAYKVLTSAAAQECTATRAAGAGVNSSAAMIVFKGASSGSPVSREFQLVYNLSAPVSREFQLVYNLSAPVTREVQLVYNLSAPVSAEVQLVYNLIIPVSAEVQLVYNLSAPVSNEWVLVYTLGDVVVVTVVEAISTRRGVWQPDVYTIGRRP